jgi:hypothetical protein
MNAQISRTVNGQVRCTAQMDWAPGEFMIEWVHFLHASSKKTFLCFGTSVFLEVHTCYLIYLREFCVPFQIFGTGDRSSWRLQILGWSLNWLVKQLGWDPANGSLQMMAPLACWLEGKHRSISLKYSLKLKRRSTSSLFERELDAYDRLHKCKSWLRNMFMGWICVSLKIE